MGLHKALGADFYFVIVVRNPIDHTVFLISHILEIAASSVLMLLRLGRCSFIRVLSMDSYPKGSAERRAALGRVRSSRLLDASCHYIHRT